MFGLWYIYVQKTYTCSEPSTSFSCFYMKSSRFHVKSSGVHAIWQISCEIWQISCIHEIHHIPWLTTFKSDNSRKKLHFTERTGGLCHLNSVNASGFHADFMKFGGFHTKDYFAREMVRPMFEAFLPIRQHTLY